MPGMQGLLVGLFRSCVKEKERERRRKAKRSFVRSFVPSPTSRVVTSPIAILECLGARPPFLLLTKASTPHFFLLKSFGRKACKEGRVEHTSSSLFQLRFCVFHSVLLPSEILFWEMTERGWRYQNWKPARNEGLRPIWRERKDYSPRHFRW